MKPFSAFLSKRKRLLAAETRNAALVDLQDARKRKDTRAVHQHQKRLKWATHRLLSAEVGK